MLVYCTDSYKDFDLHMDFGMDWGFDLEIDYMGNLEIDNLLS